MFHRYPSINILVNENKDLDDFGSLLNETWKLKRSLSESVSNTEIDLIYENAMKSGAIGGKLLGAGGGGFILFYAKKHNHQAIINSLKGLIYVPFKFENNGSEKKLCFQNSKTKSDLHSICLSCLLNISCSLSLYV